MDSNTSNTIKIDPQTGGQHIVIEYGARLYPESQQRADAEIRRARALYNTLVAEMRSIFDEMQAFVVDKAGSEAQSLAQRIDVLSGAFKAAKATDDEPEMKRIAVLRRDAWKALSVLLKDTRKEYKNELIQRFYSQIGNNSSTRTYQIRCDAVREGLGGFTATAILNNALVAWQKSMAHGKPPRFAVGAEQIQDTLTIQFTEKGGLDAAKVFTGQNKSLSVDLPSKGFIPRSYTPFRFRLGAAKADDYAEGTLQAHRPIPPGARIALARLIRRKIGPKTRYALQLSINLPDPVRLEAPARRASLCAIHIGWSADDDGRRIAGISGDGQSATWLRLPTSIEAEIERANNIQGLRDSARDAVVAKLKAELVLPELSEDEALWMLWEKIRKLPATHISANRLHHLAHLLRDRDILPDWLGAWRKADRMHWQSATSLARRARNRRQWFYRNEAKKLAERYETILVEQPDMEAAARKLNEVTGEKTDLAKKARSGRTVAAVSHFIAAVKWAACRYGCAVLALKGEKTASTCSECGGGHLDADREDGQKLLCLDCGATLDRKENAAILAWRKGSESLEALVIDYWETTLAEQQGKAAKKAEKQAKMAQGRREKAAARKAMADVDVRAREKTWG